MPLGPTTHLRTALLLGVLWISVLAVLTLGPGPLPVIDEVGKVSNCLICGDRGTADALLNIVLFVPFGLLVASGGVPLSPSAGLAVLLSVGVELAQFVIPGRYSNLGDILWNTVGAVVGVGLWRSRRYWLAFEGGNRNRLALLAVSVAWAVPLASGWLLEPRWEPEPYWGQWTPDLGVMEVYQGQVLDAHLDTIPIPSARFPPDAGPRRVLTTRDWVMRATVVRGPPPTTLAPVLNIYDGEQREMTLLGALGQDLVWRERTRATVLRLDQPALALRRALSSLDVGDTMFLAVRRRGGDRCLSIQDKETCGVGFTPGRAWGFLLYDEGTPELDGRLLDAGWMLLLFLPIGFWAPSSRILAGNALVAAAGIALAVAVTRLIPGPWTEWAGMGLGLWTGWRLRRFGLVRSAVSDRERA